MMLYMKLLYVFEVTSKNLGINALLSKASIFYSPKFKFQDNGQNTLFAELKCFCLNIINARDMSQNSQTVAVGITTTNNDYVSGPFTFQD